MEGCTPENVHGDVVLEEEEDGFFVPFRVVQKDLNTPAGTGDGDQLPGDRVRALVAVVKGEEEHCKPYVPGAVEDFENGRTRIGDDGDGRIENSKGEDKT